MNYDSTGYCNSLLTKLPYPINEFLWECSYFILFLCSLMVFKNILSLLKWFSFLCETALTSVEVVRVPWSPVSLFIVGLFFRDKEYIYYTAEGRQELLDSLSMDRLAVIHIPKCNDPVSLDTVKEDLTPLILDVAPAECRVKQSIIHAPEYLLSLTTANK